MKRLVRPALGAALLLALAATPALANHSHVMLLGNGQCVVLAEGGGEDDVVLPLSVFDAQPATSDVALDGCGSIRSTCSSTRASPASARLIRRLRDGRRRQRHVRGGLSSTD